MSLVPETRIRKIGFFESHLPPWQAHAAAIGLSPAQVAVMNALTGAARASYDAHRLAQETARAATLRYHQDVARMKTQGAELIRAIRDTAESADDPNVYVLAAIPAPARPSPAPPPGLPTGFRVGLLQSGAVTLSWKCANPPGIGGTMYEVRRRMDETGEGPPEGAEAFVFVGSTGAKRFIDETLPLGPASVTYQITAVRSTARGKPGRFTVQFGVGEEGRSMAEGQVAWQGNAARAHRMLVGGTVQA